MKFCEKFGISPNEYAKIPQKKILTYWQMMQIEADMEKSRSGKDYG
jgi:hypothetical protein